MIFVFKEYFRFADLKQRLQPIDFKNMLEKKDYA